MTTFTLTTKDIDQNTLALTEYFECEKNGRNNTCSHDSQQHPVLSLMAFVLLGLYPTVNLLFAINVQELKALVKQLTGGCFNKTLKHSTETKTEKSTFSSETRNM